MDNNKRVPTCKRIYTFDEALRIWRTLGHETIAYSDGEDIELRLLDALKQCHDVSSTSDELRQHIVDWPSEYHFSPLRHALIRPIDISPSSLFLELGCGCGALTRYLGETGATVVAVEGSLQRAQIAAERCRDLPNVRIYCDNLADFSYGQRFDFVSLIGVLEYAPLFIPGSDPVNKCLRIVKDFLAPGGKLILAIENQLGLKYFNGCQEDHIGKQYFGVQDLYAGSQPITYGKHELAERLREADFSRQAFFFPFPDYKLPQIILSDQGIADKEFSSGDLLCRTLSQDHCGEWLPNFHENLARQALARNRLLADMANSFLVLADAPSPEDGEPQTDGWLASIFSLERKAAYATETRFKRSSEGISVHKHLLVKERAIPAVGCFARHDPASLAPYICGRSYLSDLQRVLALGGTLADVAQWAKPWVDILLAASAQAGADATLPDNWLDAIPANFIVTRDGQLEIIDVEWRANEPVPLAWILIRGLVNSVTASPYSPALSGITFRQLIDDCLLRLNVPPLGDSAYLNAADLEDRLAQMVYGSVRTIPRLGKLLIQPVFSYCTSGKALKDENQQLKNQLAQMQASRSWRITAPLRAVDQQLKKLPGR
jgi:SAM-dependent methyltransferase